VVKNESHMNDPISLELKRSEPIPEVVAHLKMLLEQAESGDLRCFLYVGRTRDLYQRGHIGDWPDGYAMIGSADVLKEEIYREMRENFNELTFPETE